MERKSLTAIAISMSLALAFSTFFESRALAMPQPGAGAANQEQNRVDMEMMSHQRAMEILLNILRTDFQAVVKSKDANGYVHDKAAVKTYKGDLDALSVVTGQHKQFAADYGHWCGRAFSTDYQHWCGPDVKENAMAEHQKRMKAILFELSNTFDNYLTVDDHSIEGGPNKIQDAFDAHRDALNDLADAIKDHEQAVARMMTGGADHGDVLLTPLPESTLAPSPAGSKHSPLPEKR